MAAGALDSIPAESKIQIGVRSQSHRVLGQARTVNGLGPSPTTSPPLTSASAAKRPSPPSRASTAADIAGGVDQSAAFFDPKNEAASELREKVALETLDELLDYVLYEGGSVGILDATNSTLRRRKAVLDRIRQVAGKQIGVVFLESECSDPKLLEANMRLKLQGPDYKDSDPVQALADFKKRGSFAVVAPTLTG